MINGGENRKETEERKKTGVQLDTVYFALAVGV